MISWRSLLLGKHVVIHTVSENVHTGIFESVQGLGNSENPYIVLKEYEGDQVTFIPDKLVEAIYVQEPGVPGEDGEGSGADGDGGDDDTEATDRL